MQEPLSPFRRFIIYQLISSVGSILVDNMQLFIYIDVSIDRFSYEVAFKLAPKKAEKPGGGGAFAQHFLGKRRQRRALGREQTRAAKSCGVRGIFKVKNHFPALCGCFNLSAT